MTQFFKYIHKFGWCFSAFSRMCKNLHSFQYLYGFICKYSDLTLQIEIKAFLYIYESFACFFFIRCSFWNMFGSNCNWKKKCLRIINVELEWGYYIIFTIFCLVDNLYLIYFLLIWNSIKCQFEMSCISINVLLFRFLVESCWIIFNLL